MIDQAKLIIGAAVLAVIFSAGWWAGSLHYKAKTAQIEANYTKLRESITDANRALIEQLREVERAWQETTDELAIALAKQADLDREKADSIQAAVAAYQAAHPPDPDADSCLDPEWVRIVDRATVQGTGIPKSAKNSFASSGAFTPTPADALAVITRNYAIAATCARRLNGWQEWYQSIK